jgi:hypothetical protein
MNIRKKIRDLEEEHAKLKKRLAILEAEHGLSGETGNKTLELDLVLPQADIDGLHFNEQKVHAVFEKQDDGWWYSRDILFLSARNTKDDNSRDILTKYLNHSNIRAQIGTEVVEFFSNIEVALPQRSYGTKKYNGVDWWYWLAHSISGYAANFCLVNLNGATGFHGASVVGGCAPAFRIKICKT